MFSLDIAKFWGGLIRKYRYFCPVLYLTSHIFDSVVHIMKSY